MKLTTFFLLIGVPAALVIVAGVASAAGPSQANPSSSALIESGPPDEISLAWDGDRVTAQQRMLSSLWTFATLNYLYCDVVGLMDSTMLKQYSAGKVNGTKITEGFLLGATLLMEVPMAMIFLSTELEPGHARIANIAAGILMTVVQAGTLAVGKPTSYYLASSIVEIATTGFITIYSLFFMKLPPVAPVAVVSRGSFAVNVGLTF